MTRAPASGITNELLRRSPGPHAGVLAAPFVHLREIWARRELVAFLVDTRLRGKVVNTLLGPLWHMIPPVVQIAVYFVVVNYIFNRGGEGPRAVFVSIAVGILHWSFLGHCLNGSASSISNQANLLKQTPISPVVFVFANLREELTQLVIKVCIAAVIVLTMGPAPTWRLALYPVWIGLMVLNVWWMSLIIATLSVFFRDIEKATSIFVLLVMYLCPVIYGVGFLTSEVGGVPILDILMLNPLASTIGMVKWSVLGDPPVPLGHITLSFASTLVFVFVAHTVYERARPRITKAL